MPIQKTDNLRKKIISAPQTLTGSYADIGAAALGGPFINSMDCASITLWLKITINDSTGIKIKMLGANAAADSVLYQTIIKDVQASSVNVVPSEVFLSNDEDQSLLLSFSVSDQVPLVKFQVMALVAGATAATIDECYVTFTSRA